MIYLASQSPQRAALLKRTTAPFTVVASSGDEETVTGLPAPALAVERARIKARGAVLKPPIPGESVVVSADTVVALGNELIGKPADRTDAMRILSALSGSTHHVFTGTCVIAVAPDSTLGTEAVSVAMAKVTMRRMTPEEIRAYVDSGESDGRAGAYAIQESGDRFIADLAGGWDTVVGLNLAAVVRLYREALDRVFPGIVPIIGRPNRSGAFPAIGGQP